MHSLQPATRRRTLALRHCSGPRRHPRLHRRRASGHGHAVRSRSLALRVDAPALCGQHTRPSHQPRATTRPPGPPRPAAQPLPLRPQLPFPPALQQFCTSPPHRRSTAAAQRCPRPSRARGGSPRRPRRTPADSAPRAPSQPPPPPCCGREGATPGGQEAARVVCQACGLHSREGSLGPWARGCGGTGCGGCVAAGGAQWASGAAPLLAVQPPQRGPQPGLVHALIGAAVVVTRAAAEGHDRNAAARQVAREGSRRLSDTPASGRRVDAAQAVKKGSVARQRRRGGAVWRALIGNRAGGPAGGGMRVPGAHLWAE
jgi:hypothetical protein